jgi:hypothetical protein
MTILWKILKKSDRIFNDYTYSSLRKHKSPETTEIYVSMSVISMLSSSQGFKGNESNISLAKEILGANVY